MAQTAAVDVKGEAAAPEHVALDSQGRIDADALCSVCGYNLRSLSPQAACSECGTAVADSLRVQWLSQAPRAWLRRVRWGVVMSIVSLTVWLTGSVVFWIWIGFQARWNTTPRLLLISGLSLVELIGAWWTTTPEHARPASTRSERLRRTVRAVVVASFALETGMRGWFHLLGWWSIDLKDWVTLAVLNAASGLLGGLAAVTMWLYLAQLAQRAPNRRLGGAARTYGWCAGALCLLSALLAPLLVMGLYYSMVVHPGSPLVQGHYEILEWAGTTLRVVSVGLSMCGLILLVWFHRVLGRSLTLSSNDARPADKHSP